MSAREPDALPVAIVGKPSAESDAAVERFLERLLEREQPGTRWTAYEHAQDRRAA
jgi:hypothetical protein